MKRVLVTGGSGFLGSHLCENLLKHGNYVYCLDNFYTSSSENLNYKDHYNDTFEIIKHDITSPFFFDVDEIYNLACPASPIHYQKDPVRTIKTNILGSINVLDLAKKINATVFQASTSEIYGDPIVSPQKESYWGNVNPIGIRSCYDEGKRSAETLFFDYLRQYDLNIKVVRIFNTYGPRMLPNDGRVISNFIVQALTGKDITIYGDGSQTRSFCFVDDMIDGFKKMMNSRKELTGPINLGNPVENNMLEIAEKILLITKSKSKITFKPLPKDDPKQRKPDIFSANANLKWKPKVSLEDGLDVTINFFKNKYF